MVLAAGRRGAEADLARIGRFRQISGVLRVPATSRYRGDPNTICPDLRDISRRLEYSYDTEGATARRAIAWR